MSTPEGLRPGKLPQAIPITSGLPASEVSSLQRHPPRPAVRNCSVMLLLSARQETFARQHHTALSVA